MTYLIHFLKKKKKKKKKKDDISYLLHLQSTSVGLSFVEIFEKLM
jgi:hypothetical protein